MAGLDRSREASGTARWLRWVLLLLYGSLVFGLCSLGFYGSDEVWPMVILTGVTVGSWVLFLVGAGRQNLCRPIRKRRLLLPVITAAALLAILCVGLSIAFAATSFFLSFFSFGGGATL